MCCKNLGTGMSGQDRAILGAEAGNSRLQILCCHCGLHTVCPPRSCNLASCNQTPCPQSLPLRSPCSARTAALR